MKILSFAVNNFRALSGGLQNNRVDFKESNTIFLFGQNNVGKSTFLKTYEFFYKSDTPKEDDFFKIDTSKEMEFELEVELTRLLFYTYMQKNDELWHMGWLACKAFQIEIFSKKLNN